MSKSETLNPSFLFDDLPRYVPGAKDAKGEDLDLFYDLDYFMKARDSGLEEPDPDAEFIKVADAVALIERLMARNSIITDLVRAARYRRKLEDLLAPAEEIVSEVLARLDREEQIRLALRLNEECLIVRSQLEVEKQIGV